MKFKILEIFNFDSCNCIFTTFLNWHLIVNKAIGTNGQSCSYINAYYINMGLRAIQKVPPHVFIVYLESV